MRPWKPEVLPIWAAISPTERVWTGKNTLLPLASRCFRTGLAPTVRSTRLVCLISVRLNFAVSSESLFTSRTNLMFAQMPSGEKVEVQAALFEKPVGTSPVVRQVMPARGERAGITTPEAGNKARLGLSARATREPEYRRT